MARRVFERKDRFYKKAKKEGYPARSAYKIIEFDDKYKIFKSGNVVVDLGAAPGGWFKVGQERLNGRGRLIGIDLLPLNLELGKNEYFLQQDFLSDETKDWIREKVGKGADWVISDMSPNISGIKFKDEYASYKLSHMAMTFALEVLKPTGSFVFKVFPGPELEDLRKELKTHFKMVKTSVPEATRTSSTEVYVICQGRKKNND